MSQAAEPDPTLQPPDDPYEFFAEWHAEARATAEIRYAGAAHLATVDEHGQPDGRVVLLEHFDAEGFVFTTDARSEKARQIGANPAAALTIYWEALERQVRVRGTVAVAAERFADAAFMARPRRSRLTPWASCQSAPHGERRELEERYRQAEERFAGHPAVPRPETWRAWCLRPRRIEFWHARTARLHDRWRYEGQNGAWRIVRLDP